MSTHVLRLEDPLDPTIGKDLVISDSLYANMQKYREKRYAVYGNQIITIHMMGYETETHNSYTLYTKSGWVWITDPKINKGDRAWLDDMIDKRFWLALITEEARERVPHLLHFIPFNVTPRPGVIRVIEYLDYQRLPIGITLQIS